MKIQTALLPLLALVTCKVLAVERYSDTLCKDQDYYCITIQSTQSWDSLFKNPEQQDLIKRLNRVNTPLKAGMRLALPKQMDRLSIYDLAPFPRYISSEGEKVIYVSQKKLAWAAYDSSGELIWWGPISSGSGKCRNIEGHCITPSGSFRIINKQDIDCQSTSFPMRLDGLNGGAQMPFCMHFLQGYALHGSDDLPGYRASHGCVRMLIEDARWLNEQFVETTEFTGKGTRVVIDSLSD